jgi:hypothetical protein
MDKRKLAALTGAVAMALLAGFGVLQAGEEPVASPPVVMAAPAAATMVATQMPASAAAPFSSEGMRQRREQLAQWQQRLERAKQTLDSYRESTRYPYDSRPISEHPDQVHPFEPIAEDKPLRSPGGQPAPGVRLRSTQDRVFVGGAETVRFTVSAHDDAGKALPLLVTRAVAFDLPDPSKAVGRPQVPMVFADAGRDGDQRAGDGVYSAQLQPSTQGFADHAGTIRVQLDLNQGGNLGMMFFDVIYEPQVPAVWAGGVREALQGGSLDFYLKADVARPGRYVVTGRVDDAHGKPYALLSFNDEVEAGAQEFRLRVFGKLVRDTAPAFPLTLRDVEGFLLIPDRFPDRAMMARRAGPVHTSASYPPTAFSDAEWSSEERDRYLTELTRDVEQAQDQVDRLAGR